MKILIEKKNFQIPDACPIDAPKNRILKRHLREHGIESLFTSKKLSQLSGCILGELLEEGAEIVEPGIETDKQEPSNPEPTQDDADNILVSQEYPN